MSVRLNKYLADRGIGARRKCDDLIAEGRVSINGEVVREVGVRVDEQRDRVQVDGRPVGGRGRNVYYVLNKPVGVITTLDDPQGRRTVREFLPRGQRVYPVGRLDADTSGLLFLTNDGELAHKLMHPRYGVAKVYRVRLSQEPRADQLRRLASGVRFDKDLVSGPARVRRIDPGFDAIMIEIIIHEGRFRQVRKMCEAVGLPVSGLHRVGYGPIRLGPLPKGMFRELSEEEVAALRAAGARPGGDRPRSSGPRAAGADGARAARPSRGAAPAFQKPVRIEPAPPTPEEFEEESDEIEDSWVAGGGFLPRGEDDEAPGKKGKPTFMDEEDDEDDDDGVTYRGAGAFTSDDDEDEVEEASGSLADAPPAWPARPDRRRGDAAWLAENPEGAAAKPRPRRESSSERPRAARPSAGGGSRFERPSRPSAGCGSRFERPSRPSAGGGSRFERPSRPSASGGSRFERPSRPSAGAARAERPRRGDGPRPGPRTAGRPAAKRGKGRPSAGGGAFDRFIRPTVPSRASRRAEAGMGPGGRGRATGAAGRGRPSAGSGRAPARPAGRNGRPAKGRPGTGRRPGTR